MILLETAKRLKLAGLEWLPAVNDFFAIPDRDLDERTFVVSDIQATIEMIQGSQVVAFQGASEWALDDLQTSELVWLPREDQLRKALGEILLARGHVWLSLECDQHGCTCTISHPGLSRSYHADNASEAYAAALLDLMAE